MKIAHISATFPPYEAGTGRVCYHNALELARLGHDVTVYTANHPPGEFDYPPELTVVRLPFVYRIGNAPLMFDLLKLRDYDLLHLHFPQILTPELVWLVSRLRGMPYVLTHHNDLKARDYRRYIFAVYYPLTQLISVRGARKFIVVSEQHALNCELTPIFKRRWEDVEEVSNGVDVAVFRPLEPDVGQGIRQEWGIPADAPLLGFVGALDRAHDFKNVDLLLKAFQRLERADTHLMIVGDGDMRPEFEALARELGLAERTHFIGKIASEELARYYAALDVEILPSSPPESFGMVLIEAGACKRPVIASDIPGVNSVVDDGVTGYLFPEGDVDALVARMRELIDQPTLRQQMGQAGYDKAHAKYTWQAIAKRLEDVYQRTLNE